MRQLFLFIILLLPFFFGCQEYNEPTNTQFNINGEWKIINIQQHIPKMFR